MKPADLAIVLDDMFKQSMRIERAHDRLFEAIDRHDKFSTVPTSTEIREWLRVINKAMESQWSVHYAINELMDDLEDEAQAVQP